MSVRVTRHAVDRAVERFPELRDVALRDVSKLIRREILDAQEHGRRSASEPSFMVTHTTLRTSNDRRRRRTKRLRASTIRKHGTLRYFWTESERRVYKAARAVENRVETWVVVTTFRGIA